MVSLASGITGNGVPPIRAHGKYGEMTGLTPGFIKRANLAWYASHHHDAAGKNVDYAYSYLFGYVIDLPPGAKTHHTAEQRKHPHTGDFLGRMRIRK